MLLKVEELKIIFSSHQQVHLHVMQLCEVVYYQVFFWICLLCMLVNVTLQPKKYFNILTFFFFNTKVTSAMSV